jgi:excisionase family DNA binding protein
MSKSDENEAANDNRVQVCPDIMSAEEAAVFLGIGRRQTFEAAGRGDLSCRRVGRRILFYRPALEAWLAGKQAA